MTRLGAILKRYREHKRLTQGQISGYTGIQQSVISRTEKGIREKRLTVAELVTLVGILEIPLLSVLEEAGYSLPSSESMQVTDEEAILVRLFRQADRPTKDTIYDSLLMQAYPLLHECARTFVQLPRGERQEVLNDLRARLAKQQSAQARQSDSPKTPTAPPGIDRASSL